MKIILYFQAYICSVLFSHFFLIQDILDEQSVLFLYVSLKHYDSKFKEIRKARDIGQMNCNECVNFFHISTFRWLAVLDSCTNTIFPLFFLSKWKNNGKIR